MTASLPRRSDVAPESKWDIEHLFATPAEWDAEFAALEATLPSLAEFKSRLANPDMIAAYLGRSETLASRLSRLNNYAFMSASVDASDTDANARRERVTGLAGAFAAAIAFAEPELLALPADTLSAWTRTPELRMYAHFFDNLERQRPHVRSADVEEVLGLVRGPFGAARTIHPTLVNTDLDLGTVGGVKIGHGNIDRLTQDPDREVRRGAWEAYADAHLKFANTMAASLSAGVRQDVFVARVRGYENSLHAALSPNNIPVEVFHTLIDTYRRHVGTWHRYWRARARLLGLERLREYDVKAPLTAEPPRVSYEQSVEWICEGMAPLGTEYVNAMRSGLTTERWVDVYPNEGKRQGAYSSGTQGTLPYIFMSYADSLFSLSTLAHEIGHSMHSYLTWRSQPYVYSRYSLFVAEVASNFNQAMVRRHLFGARPDEDFQIALIEEAMSNFHRYFFIMPTLARFELDIHERVERGEALSARTLNALMADLLAEGYGDGVEMDRERSGVTWAQFSTHLYSNFYVFQYATGISAAHQLLARFDGDTQAAREDYLAFLRAGGSLYPLDALKLAGVDMRSGEAVERTFEVLADYVDRLEKIVDAREGR
ncbi:oligoendopeptidase F [Deinococcus yavapaiensis]|uniref:Oligopeptidase F n=1 Tax=Deinococcus yavapaiensis KR-236 TaxID=694435 RepID=A0A318SD69_9DEIO|nr:oligoendopeptidase F [Deinococcus yavapaiensis]PYE49977.1 oligopeptidase F [Deinococcus yavapaiensis KR-236]